MDVNGNISCDNASIRNDLDVNGNATITGHIDVLEIKTNGTTPKATFRDTYTHLKGIIKLDKSSAFGGLDFVDTSDSSWSSKIYDDGDLRFATTSGQFHFDKNIYPDQGIINCGNISSTTVNVTNELTCSSITTTGHQNSGSIKFKGDWSAVDGTHPSVAGNHVAAGPTQCFIGIIGGHMLGLGRLNAWGGQPAYLSMMSINVYSGLVNCVYGLAVDGSAVSGSDDRMKHNETNLTNCLSVIDKLSPEIYDKGYKIDDTRKEIGFIAQEVEQIPELESAVTKNDNRRYVNDDDGKPTDVLYYGFEDMRYLDYNQIFTYNVGATKELHKIVKSQQIEIDQLKAQLAAQQQQINEIMNRI